MSCGSNNNKMSEENIFLPREAEVVSARMITASEKHFQLRMKDGSQFDFLPGKTLKIRRLLQRPVQTGR